MKEILKIVLTNWVNVLTVYACMFVTLLICELYPGIATFKEAVYNTFGSLIVYYVFFWIGFLICILVLDIVLFGFNRESKYTTIKLLIEWLIISVPFIYWLIRYNQWIFLAAVLAFLLGQYLRRPYIFKILTE